jgi:hypothetical protein
MNPKESRLMARFGEQAIKKVEVPCIKSDARLD